jgi:3-oxoacyl-[acyl-carrier-protein] synthase-3
MTNPETLPTVQTTPTRILDNKAAEKQKAAFGSHPTRYAHVVGWGMALPQKLLTNNDLARMVDTTDEWIVSRTGIRQRYIVDEKESTATLATQAASNALEMAGIAPSEVDLIIVATATPEHLFPATACLVQDALGCENAGAFDLLAACTGFVYGITLGSQMIRSGANKTVLVIGAETLSRIVNWEDRATCVLFGDGAGAFVLQASDQPGGVLTSFLRSDGSGGEALSVPAGGSKLKTSYDTLRDNLHAIQMNGREVFRFATRVMASAVKTVVDEAGLTLDDIHLVVPHQANTRIIESAAEKLKIPESKFVVTLDKYGNTSSASIPIAICEAFAQGRIKPKDKLVLVGFGGGLTWGATLLEWGTATPKEQTRWNKTQRNARKFLSRLRSFSKRILRMLEGAIWGRSAPSGEQPPRSK